MTVTKVSALIGFATLILHSTALPSSDFSGLITRNGVVFSVNNYGLYSYNSSTDISPLVGNDNCIPDLEPPLNYQAWEIILPDTSEFTSIPDIADPITLGNQGQKTEYLVNEINLSDRDTLTIDGDVTLVLSGDLNINAQASIIINDDASLKIYSEDHISIGGDGVLNLSVIPARFSVYGTAPAYQNHDESYYYDQNIRISGNGLFAGAIYAPNADVRVSCTSSGGFAGAILCNSLTVTTPWYSVDESLANTFPFGPPINWKPFDNLATNYRIKDVANEFSIEWDSTYGATYQVERTYSLETDFDEILSAKLFGTGSEIEWTDTQSSDQSKAFYRVTVKQKN